MQYLAAYTLASLNGKEPTKEQLVAILNATGKPVDDAQVTAVINSLKGKKLEDLIKAGSSKVGSGSGSGSAPVKSAPKKQQPAKKVQEKKKEPVKAPQPQPEDDFGAGDLFG